MRKAVLLVENSAPDVRALRTALREASPSNPVVTVKNGSDAQAWLNQNEKGSNPPVGIVMVNIHDAECGGLAFLEWLRARSSFSKLLIVALTERSRLREVVGAYERGVHTFLVKPIHVEDIRNLAKTYPDRCE